mmetsp:Transcript_18015/g.28826  ORF Transcript_18015/g.28826 Transcript_18015/m.28826 type:complete len:108 (-) Transcript_18015:147-470(-)
MQLLYTALSSFKAWLRAKFSRCSLNSEGSLRRKPREDANGEPEDSAGGSSGFRDAEEKDRAQATGDLASGDAGSKCWTATDCRGAVPAGFVKGGCIPVMRFRRGRGT